MIGRLPLPEGRRWGRGLAALLLLALARSAGEGHLPEPDAYVWQRRWTPALAEAVAANAGLFHAWHVMAAEIVADGGCVTT